MTDDQVDAKRQLEIHAEIERIAELESKQTEAGVSGMASRGELEPVKEKLLRESERILKRQMARLSNA